MPPNPDPQVHNILENPVRDAALHFGAYLQLKGLLQGNSPDYGTIDVITLQKQFTDYYQPQYRSYLVFPELLPTLRRYRVMLPNKRRQQPVRIAKHPHPQQVPAPGSMPRPHLYVDQVRVLRDKLVRTEVVNEAHCRLCSVTFLNEESKRIHIESDIHLFRLQYREKRSSFKDSVSGASIAITEPNQLNEVILRTGERGEVVVTVTPGCDYVTTDIYPIMPSEEVQSSPHIFRDNVPMNVRVTAQFPDPGAYIYPLVAKILPAKLCLLKDVIFRVESELMDELAPISPFIHRQDVIREMEGPILPGEELPKAECKLQLKVKLIDHKIPPVYNKLLLHKLERYDNMNQREEDVLARIIGLLCGLRSYKEALREVSITKAPFTDPLDRDNYSDRFSLLVDLEELQQQRQIKNYDRSNETLRKCNTKYMLQVPDLSEGRPSVTKGDKVHVRLQDDDKVIYEGVIHEVQEHGLLLGFHREFTTEYMRIKNQNKEPRVDVRFTVNRFPMLNMHRALSLMKKHQAYSVVFPERNENLRPAATPPLKPWVNPLIATNPEQQRAIKKIISKTSGSSPYLVFGPPGTGKTVTLVETIVQVWLATQTQAVKQLVCAPSNAACNNIAERLIASLPNAKILRLYSLSTEVAGVPEVLLPHSNFDKKKKAIYLPSMDEIMTHHIIITTIVTSGRLVTGGAGGRFQFVYIDECGQASEPEALIAIAGVLTTDRTRAHPVGQLVLAGDPQQLGPILSSQVAKDFGLGMSFLERLMTHNTLYKKSDGGTYDSNYLTKLVQNFRSHQNILEVPNKQFYDNELQVKGNPDIINRAVGWKELPNPKFPLLFYGVQGLDERESNSPSYFNRQEIDVVIMYMKKLLSEGLPNYKVKPEDIGVITPYRKQVSKFNKAFGLLGWDIRVGSVEEFQGSEKLIIFISTVRSNIALVEEDYRFKLGFLKNPKRFNVSITRAQALLVVVGNPRILRHDKQWYQLLSYCKDNGAYKGISFPDEPPPEHQQDHIAG